MDRFRLLCLLLALLLLCGCAGASEAAAPAETAVPETPAPTPLPPSLRLENAADAAKGVTLRQAESSAEVYAALEAAWDKTPEKELSDFGRTASRSEGAGAGDVVCALGDYVFVLRGKGVAVLNLGNGYDCIFTSFAVGFDWKETEQDGVWIGREKAPVELYICNGRLVVVSDWFEYRGYPAQEGTPRYEDWSHICVDIFDITDITAPRRVASYGQDGYQCAGSVTGTNLCIVSQKRLYDADCDAQEEESFLPGTYNGEERSALAFSDIDLASGEPEALYTLVCVYDLSGCVLADTYAVLGNTEMTYLADKNLYLFGRQALRVSLEAREEEIYTVTDCMETVCTTLLRFSVGDGAVKLSGSAAVEGALYDVYAARADGAGITLESTALRTFYSLYVDPRHGFENREDERSETKLVTTRLSLPLVSLSESTVDAEGETPSETLWHWSGDQVVSVESDGTDAMLRLYDKADRETRRVVAAFELGFDYREAPEARRAIYVDAERALVGVPAADSYTLLRYEEGSGFTRLMDIFTRDYSGNMRVLDYGDILYILDNQEIHALGVEDMAIIWERTF